MEPAVRAPLTARPVVEALATHPKGLAAHKVLRDVESRQGEELLLQHMEDALDRAYYSRLLETIPGNDPDSRLFLHFVRKEIDTVNLGVILRFEWRDDPSTRVLEFTTPGGLHLGESDLRRLAEANTRAELLERLKEYPVYEELKDALAAAQESGSLVPVEIALKRGLADYAQRFAHRNPLSVLPIVNYLLRKHYEVRNLRAIARGKQAGLAAADIEGLVMVI